MHAKGTVTIGGLAFGAVEVDMETDDGNKYHFVGYYADAGAGVGTAPDAEGDFSGLDHILGGCFLSVIQVPGGFGVSFDDFHGHIGTLGGLFEGAVIELGFGGGTWTSADEAKEYKVGDTLHVELQHQLTSQKS
jgi:hypothetical protein